MKPNTYLTKARLSANPALNRTCYSIPSIHFVLKYTTMIPALSLSMILEKWFIVRVLIGVDIMPRPTDRIKVLEDGDLVTVGLEDFDKRLQHSFAAHPKIDPVTGTPCTKGAVLLHFCNRFFL